MIGMTTCRMEVKVLQEGNREKDEKMEGKESQEGRRGRRAQYKQ